MALSWLVMELMGLDYGILGISIIALMGVVIVLIGLSWYSVFSHGTHRVQPQYSLVEITILTWVICGTQFNHGADKAQLWH